MLISFTPGSSKYNGIMFMQITMRGAIASVLHCWQRPGKNQGQLDSVIQAKLNLHMWLGKHDAYRPCEQLLEGLPSGYETVIDDQGAPLPPTALIYRGE